MNTDSEMEHPEATNKHPEVSVVMCTYNGARFIREQMDSILSQSYPISEIIVQDDGSTDGTVAILEEYAVADDRIRIYETENRSGINNNFITAIDRASCELIAWSDQDDIWKQDKIERQVSDIQARDLWISFHITCPFRGDLPQDVTYDRRIPNFGLERTLFLGCVPGHTMLFTKGLRDMVRGTVPDSELRRIGESFYYDAILSIVANAWGKVGCIVEPLDFHRRHDDSVTETGRADISGRSLANAARKVARNLDPEMRRTVRPYIGKRFCNLLSLLDHFPDAPYTENVRNLVRAYRKGYFPFIIELSRNRDRIFFSKEKHAAVAVLRAAFLPVTMYDYFASSYNEAKKNSR